VQVTTDWARLDQQHLWHPFTQAYEWERTPPLVIARAEGNYLFDDRGQRYFDGVSSLWVTTHGHGHPTIAEAIARQARELDHSTMLGLTHPRAVELAVEMVGRAPAGLTRVFYSDSGSTAVEIALKQAFQYMALTGRPEKRRFLHLAESYHGDTLGAVGVGGMELFHRIFGPLIVAGVRVPSPALDPGALLTLEAVLEQEHRSIAALIIEPLIQGAAGMLVHPPGYLRAVAELCRRYEVLLIADEVATGFGRTGTLFACEREGVSPDFLCLAKGLTGGTLPLAATLTTEAVYQAFVAPRAQGTTFFHGHTYTGNPIACAAALANLSLYTPEFIAGLAERAKVLQQELEALRDLPWVHEVRSVGLMGGIELRDQSGAPFPFERFVGSLVCAKVRAHGVVLRPLGDVVVWMPPLASSPEELRILGAATRAAIQESFT
jgi:adenosylmethionine-8-amino-7-oxononanoate aminotransferase